MVREVGSGWNWAGRLYLCSENSPLISGRLHTTLCAAPFKSRGSLAPPFPHPLPFYLADTLKRALLLNQCHYSSWTCLLLLTVT